MRNTSNHVPGFIRHIGNAVHSFIQGILDCFGFFVTDASRHEWIARMIPQVVGDLCGRLLEGVPIVNRPV